MPRKKQISKTMQPVEEPTVTTIATTTPKEAPPVTQEEKTVEKVAEKKKRAPNDWVRHCQQVHAKTKDVSYKEVLKTARQTYKPLKKE